MRCKKKYIRNMRSAGNQNTNKSIGVTGSKHRISKDLKCFDQKKQDVPAMLPMNMIGWLVFWMKDPIGKSGTYKASMIDGTNH